MYVIKNKTLKCSTGTNRGESFKSSGILEQSKTNFLIHKAEGKVVKEAEIKKGRGREGRKAEAGGTMKG